MTEAISHSMPNEGRKPENRSLYGQRFGRWTVLNDSILMNNGERKWLCRCECGTKRFVMEHSLLYGGSLSCGCLRRENLHKAVTYNLAGNVFGDLKVLHAIEQKGSNAGQMWRCQCSCGAIYDVLGSLLVTGRRTHCAGSVHERNYAYKDITNQRFHRLTALYRVKNTSSKRGSVIWHCRCDCGNEVDYSYQELVYANMKSCGCQKREHDKILTSLTTHVAGTRLESLRSEMIPTNNTTGFRGVYLIKGKYVAKIVFQKKAYYLGTYEKVEDAVAARAEAEKTLFDDTIQYYKQWKQRADQDEAWGEAHPIEIQVKRNAEGKLETIYSPALQNPYDAEKPG